MFLVRETSADREARILNMLEVDPAWAAVLAVVHVEWTLRRAIVALGCSPNTTIRNRLERCHGTRDYKALWQAEVMPRSGVRLPDLIRDWEGLLRAFRLRHLLVHGVRSSTRDYAAPRVHWAIDAARDVRRFCAGRGVDLDARLPVRRQPYVPPPVALS